MKKINVLIAAILMIASFSLTAQVAITTSGGSADASAMLDVQSTSKGFLPPRMTGVQRDEINSPAAGLMVWCSNCGPSGELEVFNGTSWTNMTGGEVSFHIGQSYGGGIIFYLNGNGFHGLISATSDQGTVAEWGCYNTTISGADGTAIGTGQANTTAIVNGCSTEGIAARICDDLVLIGYSDWFLPSKDELNQMYLQKTVIGDFANDYYWSSSEYNAYGMNAYGAWPQNFGSGLQDGKYKYIPYYVRAVRAF